MWPQDNLSNKLFQISNPKFALLHFVTNAAALGVVIDQTKTLSDFTVGFNAVIVGATVVNFIPVASSQYPQGEHFLVTALRGFDAASATLAASVWVAGWGDGLGMNGTFNVNNNGTDALKLQPFTVFQKGTNSPDAGWLLLSKPIMWVAQTSLLIQGTWATAPTTSNLNGRIEVVGQKLI